MSEVLELLSRVGAMDAGAVALAIAALINSVAYVLRRRADASASLVQSLLDRVRALEARVAELEAEVRQLKSQRDALIDEAEGLRDAISSSRGVIPAPPRAPRRETTGRHMTLTQELLAERMHDGDRR